MVGSLVQTKVVDDVNILERERWIAAVVIGVHTARSTYDLVVIDAHKHQVVPIALQVELANIRKHNMDGNVSSLQVCFVGDFFWPEY